MTTSSSRLKNSHWYFVEDITDGKRERWVQVDHGGPKRRLFQEARSLVLLWAWNEVEKGPNRRSARSSHVCKKRKTVLSEGGSFSGERHQCCHFSRHFRSSERIHHILSQNSNKRSAHDWSLTSPVLQNAFCFVIKSCAVLALLYFEPCPFEMLVRVCVRLPAQQPRAPPDFLRHSKLAHHCERQCMYAYR